MRTIYKFTLNGERNTLSVPKGTRFIHAANQYEQITVWAEVDTTQSFESRTLWVVGTGNPMPETSVDYIGSAILMNGNFVFHVYVEREAEHG